MSLRTSLHDVPPGKIAAVVTYLEMRAPPEAVPAPALPGATLVRMVAPDPAAYRALFRRIGGAWLWFSRLVTDENALTAILHSDAVEVYSLVMDGAEQGILELDFRREGCCEIAFLGVAAALQGRGAGRYLVSEALSRAWSRPIERVTVHTCTLDHPGALDFYRRAGFVPVRRSIEIADDPRLAGVLPPDAAPHVPLID